MISKLSERTVDMLFPRAALSQDEQELYIYGFFMLFSQAFFFLLAVVCGAVLGIILESTMFYVLFSAIRRYAGGIHASKESSCTVWTSLSLLLCIAAIKACSVLSFVKVPLALCTLSLFYILSVSPLDSVEKPLTKQELTHYRKKSCRTALLIWIAGLLSLRSPLPTLFYACAVSLFLEAVLLLLGNVKKRFQSKKA